MMSATRVVAAQTTTAKKSQRNQRTTAASSSSPSASSARVVVAALASAVLSFNAAAPEAFAKSFAKPAAQDSAPVETIFDGAYYDPNHPGCPRTIVPAKGGGVTISGLDPVPFERGRGCRGVKKTSGLADTKFKSWSIPASVRGEEITIDFDAKDGSGEKVTGVKVANGIKLPDGTVWQLKSGAKSDAWTPR
jgi:hypothetical protein